jgi:predicted methyltransferase
MHLETAAMRRLLFGLTALILIGGSGALAQATAPHIAAAVADAKRPAEDRARDADRKPGDMLAFAEIGPGDKVADIVPAAGYFSRMFAVAVGERGAVYAVVPKELTEKYQGPSIQGANALAAAYPNIKPLNQPMTAFDPPEKLDVVWISQNYHDMHTPIIGSLDMKVVNKAVFDALKPGGLYVVLDHSAPAGSGLRDVNTTHRIDPEAVRAEVTAAGFVFDGESNALRNPADDRSKNVFDPAIRGKTDQFVYRFRKPG